MNCPNAHKALIAIACIGIAALAFLLASAAGRGSHFNPDESRWISRAHYLADLADPRGPTWDDRYMTRGQPPLGSFGMGLALLLQGRDLTTNPPWDFSLPWEVNVAIGNKPAPDDLAAGRTASAVLTALTALAVIAIAHTFVTPAWAVAAGAMYAIHPFTAYIGSMAMSDALFGFLIACAAWAAAALARKPCRMRAIVLGILLGLGAATKLSPLAVAAGVTAAILFVVVYSAIRRQSLSPGRNEWAILGLLVSAAAVGVFVAVYPYLWPDPIARTHNLYAFRAEEMVAQASDWPVMAVPNRLEALRRVHANFSDRYNISASLASWVELGPAPTWLRQTEIIVVAAGLAILTIRAARAGPLSPPSLAFAVLGGQALVTMFGMRSEFDRYHLPMAILGAIAAAATSDCIASRIPSQPPPDRAASST